MKQKQGDHEDQGAPEKWKMKMKITNENAKHKGTGKQQFGFNYESDEEDQTRNHQSQAPASSTYGAASTSTGYDKNKKQRSPASKPKVEALPPPAPLPVIPAYAKGPVVLDKFGNFRLADPVQAAPPRPLEPTSSTRRSRSFSRLASKVTSQYLNILFSNTFRSPRRRRRYSRSRSSSRFAVLKNN